MDKTLSKTLDTRSKNILIGCAVGVIFTIFMAYNSLNGYPYIDFKTSMNLLGGAYGILFVVLFISFIKSIYDGVKYNRKSSAFRRNLKEGDVANFGNDVVNILEIEGNEATIVVKVSKNRLHPLD